MAAKTYYERRSFRAALKTFLESRGWPADLEYREGFQSDEVISTPTVAVHFLPYRKHALQLAPVDENTYRRVIQVDAYMESEPRAMSMADDIMDFMDLTSISIVNENSVSLGTLICYDTDTISSETMAPILSNAKVIRWRAISRGSFEAHYA